MTWQYIAGFFDGEGYLGAFANRARKSEKKYWRISVAQKDKSVLEEILEFVGYGYIYHNKTSGVNRTGIYNYQIYKQRDVYKFLTFVLPFLIVKRKKAIQCISEIDTSSFSHLG